ncbi:unannotated protein [freshwater metagenome]|uniref:Unannotated protein n=1 Tax=freshwater metagenome TaxID=449393 RepID=A0A6J7EA91_9ZZZZ
MKQPDTVIVPAMVRSKAPDATGTMRPSATMALIAWKASTVLALSSWKKSDGIHSEKTTMSAAHT